MKKIRLILHKYKQYNRHLMKKKLNPSHRIQSSYEMVTVKEMVEKNVKSMRKVMCNKTST